MEREQIPHNSMKQRRRRRRRKKLLRKAVPLITFLSVFCIALFLMFTWTLGEKKLFPISFGTVDIVLDAGHGGKDCGTNYGELLEKDITLEVAKKTKELLVDAGYKVKLTRDDDTYVELSDRVAFANRRNAKVYVSIHCNSSEDGSGRGIETYYAESKEKNSKALAESIQSNLISKTGAKDREVKTADYTVILGTEMPAALVEMGFFTDEQERALLQSEEYQQKLAQGIADGILSFDVKTDPEKGED